MRSMSGAAVAALLTVAAPAVPVAAQPADLPIPVASGEPLPPGIAVRRTAAGSVYADARGRTLYGLDLRTLLRAGPDPARYCQADCRTSWEPVLAPAGAVVNIAYPQGNREEPRTLPDGRPFHTQPQSAPDWTVIAGPDGPQWVYKGWHMVYVRKGDRPGATDHDGDGQLSWNTLKHVPRPPVVTAPAGVAVRLVRGDYLLADRQGRLLFSGRCADACGDWMPLAGGLAGRGLGEWTISRTGDAAQWMRRGEPVFVASGDDPDLLPPNAVPLRP